MVHNEISFLTIYFYVLLIWFKLIISYYALMFTFVHNGNYYEIFKCDQLILYLIVF